MKQQFITIYNEDGSIKNIAIIHKWHDENNLTGEYLEYFDMLHFAAAGKQPSTEKEHTLVENCDDIKLDQCGRYKLHFTFYTVMSEFIKSEKAKGLEIRNVSIGG